MESTSTLYDAIGVSVDASTEQIRKKTRQLVNDVRESDKRNSEKNELIRFFKRARETLINPDTRKEYDQSIGIETISNDETCVNDADSIMSVQPFQPFGLLGSLIGPMETRRVVLVYRKVTARKFSRFGIHQGSKP